jgi:para-nitrobenzyl esterase
MNKLRISLIFLALVASALSAQSQTGCDNIRYRYTTAFDNFTVANDMPYGANINADLDEQTLHLDLYQPLGDLETQRPLIVIAHGGFFIGGSKDGVDVVPLCQDFARMGYVVASIEYRLGIDNIFELEESFSEAVLRGVHDSKAAVRYFRKSAIEDGNPFGIDIEKIILGGISAGGFIALHNVFIDSESELPEIIDQTQPGLGGGLEGNSGNPGFSSEVLGIFNISGALFSTNTLPGNITPVISVHGTSDNTVPYGSGDIDLLGFNITSVDGSGPIHAALDSLNLPNCLVTIEGAGHVPHVLSSNNYDVTISGIAGYISALVCPYYASDCSQYDYTDPGTIGIAAEREFDKALAVYPNPIMRGQLLKIQGISPGRSWTISDAWGREIYRHSGGSGLVLNVDWPAGLYLLRTSGTGLSTPFLVVD